MKSRSSDHCLVTAVAYFIGWTLLRIIHVIAENHCIPTDHLPNSDGVCISNNSSGENMNKALDEACTIWNYKNDWVLSGRALRRNEIVPGLIPDVMIPWKQHSTRSFPRWGRHHYFFRNPNVPLIQQTNEFIFAPGYKYPFACHQLYANLAVNYTDVFISAFSPDIGNSRAVMLNPPITTDRTIAVGDPLFLPCIDATLSSRKVYEKFPPLGWTVEALEDQAEYCLDMESFFVKELKVHGNDNNSKEYGTFAKSNIEEGASISWGIFIPIHRTELRDPLSNQDELLINYCYTPNRDVNTSPLLLLPLAPGANAMNHANRTKNQKPNVAIVWMDPTFRPDDFFHGPTELLFGESEKFGDEPPLMVEYIATRDIAVGEELLLDYGDAWQDAWDAHILKQKRGEHSDFRHPIGLPPSMIPDDWLRKESIRFKMTHREWLLPTLHAGELQRIQLSDAADATNEISIKDTRQIQGMVDRIGLPIGLSDFMAKWAEEIGITNVLRAHVRGELTLPPNGERHLRLNGTTWWVKRFPVDWRSDMHYISPDDFESNQLFMNALADAGFDTVLNAVGKRDNLTSITVYYPSFIAVSHCTSSLMHNDSEDDGHYNVIFPVLQVNNSKPELIVGDDNLALYAPYKYEPDHAVVLGKFGLHGTAPCDYRGTDSMRMVVSVYMLDGDNTPTREKVLKEWLTSDPPYPRIPDRDNFIKSTKHWKRDDARRNLRNPTLFRQDALDID
jgi:hypothetical protein